VTFHAVDYLAHPHRPATLRQQWKSKSKAFDIVDDIAHAFKHVKVGNPVNPDLRAKEVVSMPVAWDVATFDVSTFDVGSVTLTTDSTVNVLNVVKEAAAFARQQLDEENSQLPADRRP
jgi:hypothetical protein